MKTMKRNRSAAMALAIILSMLGALFVLPGTAHALDTEATMLDGEIVIGAVTVEDFEDDCDPFEVDSNGEGTWECNDIAVGGPLGSAVVDLICDLLWDDWPVDSASIIELENCQISIAISMENCTLTIDPFSLDPFDNTNDSSEGRWFEADVSDAANPVTGCSLGSLIDAIISLGGILFDITFGFDTP